MHYKKFRAVVCKQPIDTQYKFKPSRNNVTVVQNASVVKTHTQREGVKLLYKFIKFDKKIECSIVII